MPPKSESRTDGRCATEDRSCIPGPSPALAVRPAGVLPLAVLAAAAPFSRRRRLAATDGAALAVAVGAGAAAASVGPAAAAGAGGTGATGAAGAAEVTTLAFML